MFCGVVTGAAVYGVVVSVFCGVTLCDGAAGTVVVSGGVAAGVDVDSGVRALTCVTCCEALAFAGACGATAFAFTSGAGA